LPESEVVSLKMSEKPPLAKSYIYACNSLTDEFLFGDDIMIDEAQTKLAGK
jgi:hypothetical protein